MYRGTTRSCCGLISASDCLHSNNESDISFYYLQHSPVTPQKLPLGYQLPHEQLASMLCCHWIPLP